MNFPVYEILACLHCFRGKRMKPGRHKSIGITRREAKMKKEQEQENSILIQTILHKEAELLELFSNCAPSVVGITQACPTKVKQ